MFTKMWSFKQAYQTVYFACQVFWFSMLSRAWVHPMVPMSCQNNHMWVEMWQEEKQRMTEMVVFQTKIVLLSPEPRCPSQFSYGKIHWTTDLIAVPWHKSHSSSQSDPSCFSSNTCIILTLGVNTTKTINSWLRKLLDGVWNWIFCRWI